MSNEKTKREEMSKNETFYADKIIGIGLGASVSKIILGIEDINGDSHASHTVVLPTIALLDFVALVDKSARKNEALRDTLQNQWTYFSEKFGTGITAPILPEQKLGQRRKIK